MIEKGLIANFQKGKLNLNLNLNLNIKKYLKVLRSRLSSFPPLDISITTNEGNIILNMILHAAIKQHA